MNYLLIRKKTENRPMGICHILNDLLKNKKKERRKTEVDAQKYQFFFQKKKN